MQHVTDVSRDVHWWCVWKTKKPGFFLTSPALLQSLLSLLLLLPPPPRLLQMALEGRTLRLLLLPRRPAVSGPPRWLRRGPRAQGRRRPAISHKNNTFLIKIKFKNEIFYVFFWESLHNFLCSFANMQDFSTHRLSKSWFTCCNLSCLRLWDRAWSRSICCGIKKIVV